MNKRTVFPKVFFGWWTVLTGCFLTLWGYGYNVYGISALFKPMSSELGFSRAATSFAAVIIKLEGAFEAPLSGWVTDRFGPRWIIIVGIVVMSSSLIMMSYIDSIWGLYLAWGVMLGTGFNMAVALPMATAISNWFVKKRGKALSIQSVFSGLAVMLIVPLIMWFITSYGWRIACVIGGLIIGLIGLPLAWFFVKPRRPEYYGLLPDGTIAGEGVDDKEGMINRGIRYAEEAQEIEFTLRQTMRTRTFWLLILVYGIVNLASIAINIHCIPFLTDIGIDPIEAAGMMAIMGAASIPARFVIGFLADRIGRNHLRFLLVGACLLPGAGLSIFLLHQTTVMIYLWFILWGFGVGDAFALGSILRGRYFGRKAFGSIGGASTLFLTPFAVVSPVYLGWVYDTTGVYFIGFRIMAILLGLATVVAFFVHPPKPPTKITGIRDFI